MSLKKLAFILTLVLLPVLFSISANASEEPMHGVWVSTVYGLDFPSVATTDSSKLKADIDTIVKNSKDTGYNTIFLQVRPSSDSFYPSDVFPWSKYLTGKNGQAPSDGFDPLKYWVDTCHANGMKIHAWINPYRVTKGGEAELNQLASNHPAKQHPEWLVKYSDGNYYFNPGIPEVQDIVYNGAAEILENYNVDGMHMDDYFYPGPDFNDKLTYQKYNNGKFSNIADWRRNNVDNLVRTLHNLSSLYGIEFGISPSGIWDNMKDNPLGSNTNGRSSYRQLFADSRGWVKKGYIDYIAPQVYWEFGHSAADFQTVAYWWADVCDGTGVKLYIGLASYNGAEAKADSVWYGGKETIKQMDFVAADSRIAGEIHFRYKLINESEPMRKAIKNYYAQSSSGYEEVPVVKPEPEPEPEVNEPAKPSVSSDITIYVNGSRVKFDTAPVIENDRILVPMRAVFEALGADVTWEQNINTAIAERNGQVMKVQPGSYILRLYDERYLLDVPPMVVDQRILMPLRAISEAFGYSVGWDNQTKTVTINEL